MSSSVPTRERLFSLLDRIDNLLKELSDKIKGKARFDDYEYIVMALVEKDNELTEIKKIVLQQMEVQIKIDKIRSDCEKSDQQIFACQRELKKCELILNTALFYARQKLSTMVNALKNPVDVEELIRYSHKISCSYGAMAPENNPQLDPRRPYPNKDEIRRGYLGHLDDSGKFSIAFRDVVSRMQVSVNPTPTSTFTTPSGSEPTAVQPLSTHVPNPASASSEAFENPSTYSPGMSSGPGGVAPSPSGMMSSNGGSGSGQWPLDHQQQQQYHQHPIPSAGQRLSSGAGPTRMPLSGTHSGSPSPSFWQQQMRPNLPGVHSSTPPGGAVGGGGRRPHVPHGGGVGEEASRMMYSDNSSDDETNRLGGPGGEYSHHHQYGF